MAKDIKDNELNGANPGKIFTRGHPRDTTMQWATSMADAEVHGVGNGILNRSDSFQEDPASGIHQTLKDKFNALVSKTDEVEQKIKMFSKLSSNNKRKRCNMDNVPSRKEVCSRWMREVMRRFGTILKQLSQHKWAWPFMEPLNVEALGLHDYYEIIEKPMDLGTIRENMKSNKYKNVREIYADAKLVFLNAMEYNEQNSDVHVMAEQLLALLEEKWRQLLPRVIDAETQQKEMDSRAIENMQFSKEAAIEKLARDTENEVKELSVHVDELREQALNSCRKFSARDRRELSAAIAAIAGLSPEYCHKILEIVHQGNIGNVKGEETEIDISAQSDLTLWKLNWFVKRTLETELQKLKARRK